MDHNARLRSDDLITHAWGCECEEIVNQFNKIHPERGISTYATKDITLQIQIADV